MNSLESVVLCGQVLGGVVREGRLEGRLERLQIEEGHRVLNDDPLVQYRWIELSNPKAVLFLEGTYSKIAGEASLDTVFVNTYVITLLR